MAKTKLTDEEQQFLSNEPEPTPLDEAVPAEDDTAAVSEPEDKPAPKEADSKPADGDKKPEAKAEPEKQKMVPHGAMEAERQRRKALEAEVAKERRERGEREARLDERMRIINEALQPKPEQPKEPDPDEDIFGAYRHLRNEVQQLRGMTAEQQQQAKQRQQQETQQQALMSAYAADARSFAAETPDFQDAYRHLLNSRDSELAALGYSPQERSEYLRNDELAIAHRALSGGKSAAEALYNLAKLRGYQGKQPDIKPDTQEAPKPDGTAEIQRLAKAQEAATSLSNAGGSAGANRISLESIDRMSKDEFKAFVAKLNKKDQYGYDKWYESQVLRG